MLQTIREHTQGWIAGVIISVIILSFALWGIHSYFTGGGANSTVAKVNGVEITKEQLAVAYERMRRQAQFQYGAEAVKDESALKNRALQALIDIEVLKQASNSQGFLISDVQIDAYLQSMPEFQVDGKFSFEKFQQELAATMLSTGDFLDAIKTSLLIDQPKLGIVLTSFALTDETNYTISLVNQEREVDYLTIPFQQFASQPVTVAPDQIQAYYNEHKNDFMTPEQVSLEYIEVTLKSLSNTINPTDTALKTFYNENINSYVQSLKGVQPKVQPYEEVKEKVREAYIRQHAEEKLGQMRDRLADLTYEHPESLQFASANLNLPIQTTEAFSKDKGGKDISQYKKIREVAFSSDVLTSQNNSDVIQLNPETLVVLRVKNHTPSTLLPLESVTNQIQAKLKTEAQERLTESAANEALAKLKAGAQLDAIAASVGGHWNKTGYLGRYATKIDTAILDLAFQLPNPAHIGGKSVFGVTRIPTGYAIVAVHAVKDGSMADTKKAQVFAEQVQNSQGLLEYELYKQSVIAAAKVKKVIQ